MTTAATAAVLSGQSWFYTAT